MNQPLKTILAAAFLSVATFCGYTNQASAANDDYCREYTRTVTIGNRVQDAYGTACRQQDGSWMIVGEGLSADIPNNASNVDYIITDNGRTYSPSQVVYYDTYPDVSYARAPSPVLIWNHDGHYRGRTYYSYSRPVYYSPRPRNNYNYHNRYDRYDRYDRHDRYERDRRPSNRNDNGNPRWDRSNNRGGYDPRDSQLVRRSRD